MIRAVVAPEREGDLIRLDLAESGTGESLELRSELETVVVVLSGSIDVSVGGVALGRAGGRASVFDGPGDAVYLPPGAAMAAVDVDHAELAIVGAPPGEGGPYAARILRPADQRVAEVGTGNSRRHVRTILGPEHEATRLLLGETINPPGNWSSYPPHKHDVERPPIEARLQEVYLFKVDPPTGFGIQLRYDQERSETRVIHDGDAVVIRSGYHPVVAAPGYSLYYLWAMAGDGRRMIPFLDPVHAWVAESPGA